MVRDNDLIASHFLNNLWNKGCAMRTILLGALIVLSLTACGSYNMRAKMDESVTQYNNLLRTQKLDAAGLFVSGTLAKEFAARAEAARKVRILDYRILATRYDEKENEAEVKVEIDYYSLSTYRMKTLVDVQKWAYREEGGTRQWRLTSLLPEFK